MNKTIGERLNEELERKRLSAPLVAELTGQPIREVVAGHGDKREPCAQALNRLAEAGIDIYYVITGQKGPTNTGESALIQGFRTCPPETRDEIIRLAAAAKDAAEAEGNEIKLFDF